ncbi:MAG: phosphoadenosine phosphosulfate reductase family protein [Crenarchaeota archaeon]|nr:phosphoadenosine phosphosulfate reductase family protein [Thermoproteota archaeon]
MMLRDLRLIDIVISKGMVEAVPIIENSKVIGYVATSSDMSLVNIYDDPRLFLWFSNIALDIAEIVRETGPVLKLNGEIFNVDSWFEPIVFNMFKTVESVEDIVNIIYNTCRKVLENSTIVLSYSGGKDSTATLIVLLKLQEKINYRLHICYTYLPFLENIKNLNYIETVANKLNINIEIISPPKRIVIKYLRKYGLPYRRCRWCTYLKVRPLREYSKKINATFHAVGDRATECEKRWKRFCEYIIRTKFISKREFRPIYTLSLIDVIEICKQNLLINPQYFRGLQRISCVVCPYKSLPELYIENIDETEDPGLLESILRTEYRRWYSHIVTFEDFQNLKLWRFVPSVAKLFVNLRKKLFTEDETYKKLSLDKYVKLISSIWREDIRSIFPRIKFEDLLTFLKKFSVSEIVQVNK